MCIAQLHTHINIFIEDFSNNIASSLPQSATTRWPIHAYGPNSAYSDSFI